MLIIQAVRKEDFYDPCKYVRGGIAKDISKTLTEKKRQKEKDDKIRDGGKYIQKDRDRNSPRDRDWDRDYREKEKDFRDIERSDRDRDFRDNDRGDRDKNYRDNNNKDRDQNNYKGNKNKDDSIFNDMSITRQIEEEERNERRLKSNTRN